MKSCIGFFTNNFGHLPQHGAAVGLHPHVRGKAPHREIFFDGVHIDVGPAGRAVGLHKLRQPWHVHIQQQTNIRGCNRLRRVEATKARRRPVDVHVAGAELEDLYAAQPCEVFQRGNSICLAAEVRGHRHRAFGRQELRGNRLRTLIVNAASLNRAVTLPAVGLDFVTRHAFGQHFTRQGQVDRALRIALHHRVTAPQNFFGNHAAGQGIIPLDIRAHQAGHVERVLHKMHIVVARARQLTAQGERCFTGNQHHRQATAKHVVHAHGRIGRSCIDVHHDGLASAGGRRIACRHVDRNILMWAQHHGGVRPTLLIPTRQLFNDRHVVGAQVGEDIVDAQLGQSFKEIMRAAVVGGLAGGGCLAHGYLSQVVFWQARNLNEARQNGTSASHAEVLFLQS